MSMDEQVFKGSAIHYIFSFAFNRLPFREKIDTAENAVTFGEYIKDRMNDNPNYIIEFHESEESEPVETRAHLYAHFRHLSIRSRADEFVEIENIGKARKQVHSALFESGMGIIWIKLKLDSGLSSLQNIIKLISLRSFPFVRPIRNGQDTDQEYLSLHSIFSLETKWLGSTINSIICDIPKETQKSWLKRYPSFYSIVQSKGGRPASVINRVNIFRITWLDVIPGLLWHDNSDTEGRLQAFEEPSVALILNVSKEIRDSFDLSSKSKQRINVERMVRCLLYAKSYDNLDEGYAKYNTGEVLTSQYPDRRFRTFMDSNRLLVLHAEEENEDDLKRFYDGIFRAFCAIRGIWHAFIIIKLQIVQIRDRLFDKTVNFMDSGNNFTSLQETIINTKFHLLYSMSTQDPLYWGVGLTPLSQFYENGSRMFKINSLRDSLVYEMREIDTLFQMTDSFRTRSRYYTKVYKKPFPVNMFTLIGISIILSYWLLFRGVIGSVLPNATFEKVVDGVASLLGTIPILFPIWSYFKKKN